MPDVDGNRGPLRIHGKARRFQNLHNAQPAHSIRKRAIASVNAANEFSGFPGQRFLRVQMWRPCVAGTVADPSLILLSRVPTKHDAFVVNLDLFARLEIVIDHHLVGPADQRSAHLYRSEPIDVNMSDQAG